MMIMLQNCQLHKRLFFIAFAIFLFRVADPVNAALDRSYLFETEVGGVVPDSAINTPADTDAGAVMGGTATYPSSGSGLIADAGGFTFHNGRRKSASTVMDCIPNGGASTTYNNYSGSAHSVALWFKTDGEWIPAIDTFNSLFSVGLTADLMVGGYENRSGSGISVALNGGYVQSFSYTGANSWVVTDPAFEGLPGQVELDDGDWHHVVRTFGPAGASTEIYIDGQLAATGVSLGAAGVNTAMQFGVAVPSAFAESFKGQIDNAHVYSNELTAAEVWNLYVSETTTTPPPLPPNKPVSPSPVNGTSGLSLNTDISWADGGGGTLSYDVYFGLDSMPDSGELVATGQAATSFNPGPLAYDTTYYWRIDAKNAGGPTTGDVWSFSTKTTAIADLAAWYEFNGNANDSMGNYDATFSAGTVIVDGQRGNVMNTSGGVAINCPYEMPTGPVTVALWFKTTQNVATLFQSGSPAGAKDIYIGGSKAANGQVGSFVWAGGPGSWINSTATFNDGQWHHLARVIGDNIISDHVLYVDGEEVARQVGVGPDSLGADNVQIGGGGNFATVAFNGQMDDIRFYNSVLSVDDIRVLAGIAGKASNPSPRDGYTIARQVSQSLLLSWQPGESTTSRDVYFGINPTPGPAEFQGNQTETTFIPGPLEFNTTYYWRIDETGPQGTNPGEVWSITTSVKNPAKPTIYHLDINDFGTNLTAEQQYDLRHVAICVQGLANRQAPRVFINFITEDELWLTRLQEPGGLCENWYLVNVSSVQELVTIFSDHINGVVLYNDDPDTGVNSTSHVASVVSGVENAIAVRKDPDPGSLYNYLVNDANGPQLTVLIDLTGKFIGAGTIWQTATASTGSRKCDAYIWAKEKYIDTGKIDPTTVFYTTDMFALKAGPGNPNSWQLQNLDYMILRQGFVLDLSPWTDEPATDEPTQPVGTDAQTFRLLLDACNIQTGQSKMIKWPAFQDCAYKYCQSSGGTHPFFSTMAEIDEISNRYNCYTEPDAPGINHISNGSFYAGLKNAATLDRRLVQNPAPTFDDMVARGLIVNNVVPPGNYIMTFMGDYDNASWTIYWCAGQRYDSNRGNSYLTWAINPTSLDRASVAMDYMYRHKTDKDYFMAPNSGAGWVMPTRLYNRTDPAYSQYPSIIPVWQQHCRDYYRISDYSISGWLLDNQAITLTDGINYAPFSGDGMGMTVTGVLALHDDIPMLNLASTDPFQQDIINLPSGVNFTCYRTIIVYPSDILSLEQQWAGSGNNHQFLDCYTYYYLMRYYLGGSNNYRATWVDDTIPRVMAAGQTYPVTVTVRNDGWDTWSEGSAYRLGYATVNSGVIPVNGDYGPQRATLPASVIPGATTTFSFNLTAPAVNGNYDLYYDMVQDGGASWFHDNGNIEWKNEIIVATNETDVDTDGDGRPDVQEEVKGTLYWHPDDVLYNDADLDLDGDVDVDDLKMIISKWLQIIPVNGLVAHWKLDESYGSVANDSVGSNNGTLMNFSSDDSQWVSSKIGGALKFDGMDDYVEIMGYQGVTGTQSRTITAWIKTTTVGHIVSWGTVATGEKWIIRVQDSNGVAGAIRAEVSAGYIVGSTPVWDGSWHLVAVVMDSDGTPDISEVKLYVDGKEEMASAVLSVPINTATDHNVTLGAFLPNPLYFNGELCDVAIYNRALGAEEILNTADLNADGSVNWIDFALLNLNWLYGIP